MTWQDDYSGGSDYPEGTPEADPAYERTEDVGEQSDEEFISEQTGGPC